MTDDICKAKLATFGIGVITMPDGDLALLHSGGTDAVTMTPIQVDYVVDLLTAVTTPPEARIAELEARILALGDAAFAGASNMAKLEAENARLRDALQFYAGGVGFTEREDNGDIARAALQQKGQENG